jgi:uncharacterized protein YxjI
MGISLNGLTPAGTYPGLIKTGDNTAISGTPKVLSDGNGNNLPMEVSTTGVNLTGSPTVNSVAIANTTQVAAKQDTLVSGTNIKTINSTSILGSGNISVVTSPSGVSGAIQFSNGSAFASDAANLFWDDTNNRLGVGLNNPTATTQIKGASTGSGTNSFIVQDSAGTNLMSVRDDGILSLFTSSKTGQLDIQGGGNSGIYSKAYSSQSDNIIRYKDYNGNTAMLLTMTGSGTGNLTVNNSTTSLSATLGIKGSGSTSATTSLLVQNSAGTQLLKVTDDNVLTTGNINIGTSGGESIRDFSGLQAFSFFYNNTQVRNQLSFSGGYLGAFIPVGGTTSSFPALKRSTTNLQVRLADDSGYAPIDASLYKIGGTNGFTGTGSYTNFTIVGGIITNAS